MEARLRSLKLTAFNPPLPRKPPGLRLCEPRGHRRGRLLMLLVCFRRCGRVRKKHHCEADEDPTRQRLQRWVSALPFFAKPESDTVSCFIVRVIWTDPRSRGYGASGLRSGTAAPAGPPASKLTPLFCSPRAPIRQTGVAVGGEGGGGSWCLTDGGRFSFRFGARTVVVEACRCDLLLLQGLAGRNPFETGLQHDSLKITRAPLGSRRTRGWGWGGGVFLRLHTWEL